MSHLEPNPRPVARDEAVIDAALAQAVGANPLEQAVMHARFPDQVAAVSTAGISTRIEPDRMAEGDLITAAGVSPLEAAVMSRRFRPAIA